MSPETNGNPLKEPKSFLSNVRNFFGKIFGMDNRIGTNQKPKNAEKRETLKTENQAKPLSTAAEPVKPIQQSPKADFNPQITMKPAKKPKEKTPRPMAIEKEKPKRIETLDHLDDAALFEKMTGEKPSEEDLAKLRLVSQEKVEEITAKPKNKNEILKEYPTIPQDELDLHGKTSIEAERELRSFIQSAKRRSLRTVRIITGKGIHSKEGEAILREVAEDKAIEFKRESLVFSHKWEKGGGSLLVYLA